MSNMDDFNKGAALILEKLYRAFPKEIVLNIEELDAEADANALENYSATVEFLGREGFIRYRSANSNAEFFLGVVLTSKGLAILNSTPEVLKDKEPLGKSLGAALKSGSKDVLKTVMEKVVESAVSGFIKGVSQ